MNVSRKVISSVLRVITFITCLLPFVIFYLPEIIDKYHNEDTTFTLKKLPIDNVTIPAITFCMTKAFKSNAFKNATKGSVNRSVFMRNPQNIKLDNISVPEFYEKVTFMLNRDFILKSGWDKEQILHKGKNKVKDVSDMIINVEEIPTVENGMCYSMTFDLVKINRVYLRFGIIPTSLTEDPKGVTLYFTTKNTRFGLIDRYWKLFKPLIINKSFAYKYMMSLDLDETQWHFQKGDPNCQEGCPMEKCFTHIDFTGLQCIPVVFKRWFEDSNLTLCSTLQDNTVSYKRVMEQRYSFKCPIPEKDVQFHAIVSDDEFFDMQHPQDAVYIYLKQYYSDRQLKKEVLIYDTATLIGSLGGFLGLFVGFSFYGTISCLMSKVCTD